MNNDSATTMNRRDFMALSSASVLLTASGFTGAEERPWYARMRRCGQINFNEKDPLALDVGSWADYWASLKVDAVLLNGGGILAFYPTEVPYHRRSEFLGKRDLFGEITRQLGCQIVTSSCIGHTL